MTKGRVHSIETMGLVDGPGIRVVVFMQGCSLRCSYCHNPDTWPAGGGQEITAQELFNRIKRYKGFFKASKGGVTLSGGDPLLQPEFVSEFFSMCRKEGIHTALDTSGYGCGNYDDALKYTDLVILDIKHINNVEHKKLTGRDMGGLIQFLDAVKRNRNKLWIRHVVVPGITDDPAHIKELAVFISDIPDVEKVELLPYHTHGVNKYKESGIPCRLEGVPPMDDNELDTLYKVLNDTLNKKLKSDSLISCSVNFKNTKKIS